MTSGSVPSPLAAAPPLPPPPPPPEATPAEAPKLFVVSGVPANVFTLRAGALIIGRAPESDLQLDHPEISRYHCRLHWDNQNAGLEDLGSRRGTKLNGALLPKGTVAPLRPGDKLEVGPVVLHFAPNAPPAVPAGPKTGDPATVGSAIPRSTMGGREMAVIPLGERKLTLGRATECDVVLSDSGVSRQHLSIERGTTGYLVTDLRSRGGSFVNGHRFERHDLVIGDQVQLGPFYFRFDGRQLVRTRGGAGVTVETQQLTKVVTNEKGKLTILDAVTSRVERGQFICILGPSGSGKSTLLNALTGLQPATSGQVLYDGADLVREYDQLRSLLGYVPQDDIVHPELTVREALLFAAQLRLPSGTPPHEIEKLVHQTIHQLGLDGAGDPRFDRTNTPIHRLSGGQRKRVSVGVELLGRPSVLFLDEPTSGLDPAAEFKMMELLRHLADGGCTVICTTHLMENAFLADKIFVIAQGKLVFAGGPQEAREHFGVQKLHALFDRLQERSAMEWQRDFQRAEQERQLQTLPPGGGSSGASGQLAIAPPPPAPPPPALPILLRRQWRILTSDLKNFLILFGQPIVIGGLVSWVAKESSLCLFFAYLSALWFGCSNAAQEIVKEIAIYRRERMVGLGRHGYLLSKFLLVGALTAAQTLLLYFVMQLGHFLLHTYVVPSGISYDDAPPVHEFLMGKAPWQVMALVATSLAAVGVGLAISALSRTAMQAVMIVPLALIPQILFSGVVVYPKDMKGPVYALTQAFPSYAAQSIMDLSCFDGQNIEPKIIDKNLIGYEHVSFLYKRDNNPDPLPPGDSPRRLGTGDTYLAGTRPLTATGKLLLWAAVGYAVAWFALRLRERG